MSADNNARPVCLVKDDVNLPSTPQVVSEAAMRYPEEVYRPEGKGGAAPAAEAELSREERRARRGAKKRTAKKHRDQKVRPLLWLEHVAVRLPRAAGRKLACYGERNVQLWLHLRAFCRGAGELQAWLMRIARDRVKCSAATGCQAVICSTGL